MKQIQEIFKLFGDSDYGLKINDGYVDCVEYEFLSKSKDKLFIITIFNDRLKRLDYFSYRGSKSDEYQWLNCYNVDEFHEMKQILDSIINFNATV